MANAVSITFDGDLKAQLQKFASDVQEKALRPAVHAGAKVLYDELKIVTPIGPTRTLNAAIYRWFDERISSETSKSYFVGVNMKKAPHWHLVEYGHWRVNKIIRTAEGKFMATTERLDTPVWIPASPYLRPTFDAKMGAAIDAVKRRMGEKIKELTQ